MLQITRISLISPWPFLSSVASNRGAEALMRGRSLAVEIAIWQCS
jgi:hypothetical protein